MIEEEEYIFELEDKTPITKPQQEKIEQENIFELPEQEEITKEEEEESLCVINDCGQHCNDQQEYFTIENLFSELNDDYKRAIARTNLGIADGLNLIWGNIQGNLLNQKDLYTFVKDSIKENNQNILDSLKLNDWANKFIEQLNLKADIFSPQFTGEPTVPLPPTLDDSNRIASTKWVNAILAQMLAGTECIIEVSPKYIYYGDNPQDITVSWRYYSEITSQSINGITLDVNTRTYTFKNVSEPLLISIQYEIGGKSYVQRTSIEIKFPIYYGVDNLAMSKTGETKFSVTAGKDQYIYILIPSDDMIAVNNIVGGFQLLDTRVINNCMYYLYKSVNSNLGLCNIEIIKQY